MVQTLKNVDIGNDKDRCLHSLIWEIVRAKTLELLTPYPPYLISAINNVLLKIIQQHSINKTVISWLYLFSNLMISSGLNHQQVNDNYNTLSNLKDSKES